MSKRKLKHQCRPTVTTKLDRLVASKTKKYLTKNHPHWHLTETEIDDIVWSAILGVRLYREEIEI